MAKIYRAIHRKISYIKIDQFKKMSAWSLTRQESIFKRYHGDKYLSEFYRQEDGENQLADIWEKKYETVTLCGSVAERSACWTQAQKGPGSNRSCDAVGLRE